MHHPLYLLSASLDNTCLLWEWFSEAILTVVWMVHVYISDVVVPVNSKR